MKSALIVGASRGLGAGLVSEHLKRGWRMTATVRSSPAELEPMLSTAGGRLAIERDVDVNRPDDVAALGRRLAGQRFDLLFLGSRSAACPMPTSPASS